MVGIVGKLTCHIKAVMHFSIKELLNEHVGENVSYNTLKIEMWPIGSLLL